MQGRDYVSIVRLAAQYRRNILLVGPTGSGKTTFANSIIAEFGFSAPATSDCLFGFDIALSSSTLMRLPTGRRFVRRTKQGLSG